MRLEQTNSFQSDSNSATASTRRIWPDAVTFREAIQHPLSAISDPELRGSAVSIDRMGMPLAYSGRFAIVFRLTTQANESWAFRCFTSPGEDGIGRARAIRYRTIEKYTTEMPNTFVPFRYLMNGIDVAGKSYPALAMRWAPGKPLGRWVEEHLDEPDALRTLCGSLTSLLERLEEAGIAHGDWQHDNLIVSEGGKLVTLVDYDGMYVPEFKGQRCPEMGHPNYQHPARNDAHFGPGLDRFGCLVIETALLALAHRPELWGRFSDGESLLFKHSDLVAPEISPLFQTIRDIAIAEQDEMLTESLVRLKDACLAGADSTLLPVMAAADAPAPIFDPSKEMFRPLSPSILAQQTTFFGQTPLAGRKWWAIPEAAPAPVIQTSVASTTTTTQTSAPSLPNNGRSWWAGSSANQATGGVAVAQRTVSSPRHSYQTAAGTTMTYLERLESNETLREEQAHLWRWRGGAAVFTSAILFMMYYWLFQGGMPPFYFLWVLNFASLGYGRWPRRRISHELTAEIEKIENLIRQRTDEVAQIVGANNGPSTTTLSLRDFTDNKLRSTSVSKLHEPTLGVAPGTIRRLKEVGINDALSLKQKAHSPELGALPIDQVAVLERWYGDLEQSAAIDWRKKVGGGVQMNSKPLPAEADRKRHEIAEFERYVVSLKQERDLFPEASFGAYVRKLTGVTDKAPSSTGSATTP